LRLPDASSCEWLELLLRFCIVGLMATVIADKPTAEQVVVVLEGIALVLVVFKPLSKKNKRKAKSGG
jgi:hypothetical protein